MTGKLSSCEELAALVEQQAREIRELRQQLAATGGVKESGQRCY